MAAGQITFRETAQKGANGFNAAPQDAAYFQALAETGATSIRLTVSNGRVRGGVS